MPINHEDILALWLQENSNEKILRMILDAKISIEDLWSNAQLSFPKHSWQPCKHKFIACKKSAIYRHHLRWLSQDQNHMIVLGDKLYPKWLQEIPDPPPVLLVKGQPQVLDAVQLAVVGSRKMSPYGKKWAYEISYECARMGMTITSGLALGIDAIAHQGALDAKGTTIAVLGSGFDHLYPRTHQNLAYEITLKGALISSFPLHAAPRPFHFPLRNRIVVGLSRACVVIEAALKSGSLISARLANEYNRDVFALPGPIESPYSQGTNALINQGAILIEGTTSIYQAMQSQLQEQPYLQQNNQTQNNAPAPKKNIINFLPKKDCLSLNQMLKCAPLPLPQLQTQLIELECQGLIKRVLGGYKRT